jgi:predicted dehydrogenase
MKNDKKLKCGVIGLGMGQGHIRGFQNNHHCEVVALADLNADLLEKTQKKYQIPRKYASAEDMIEAEELDVVSVATPNSLHAPLSILAMKKGANVFCEKPMALNLTEAYRMRDAARENGTRLGINFSFRFSNMSFALKQQVEAGVIGDIYFGRTVWHRRRGFPKFGGWFGRKELSGGGPLIDLGVHRIDLAVWLMGSPEPVSVSGFTYNHIARREAENARKEFTVEDLGGGMIRFDNGATLFVEASWAIHVNQDEQMSTTLYGDRGSVIQRNLSGGYDQSAELLTEEAGNFYTKKLDSASIPAPSPYDEFAASVLEKRDPICSAEDGIRIQKILDGLYLSAETGKEVQL